MLGGRVLFELCGICLLCGYSWPRTDTARHGGNRAAFLSLEPPGGAEAVLGMLENQRAQYPLIKEYGLNYIGLHIMI